MSAEFLTPKLPKPPWMTEAEWAAELDKRRKKAAETVKKGEDSKPKAAEDHFSPTSCIGDTNPFGGDPEDDPTDPNVVVSVTEGHYWNFFGQIIREDKTLFDPAKESWSAFPRPRNVSAHAPFGHIRNPNFMNPALPDEINTNSDGTCGHKNPAKYSYWILDVEKYEQDPVTKAVSLKKSAEELIKSSADQILDRVVRSALRGDMTACKMVLDRVYPTLRPESKKAIFRYDPSVPLAQQVSNVVAAIANGYLAPDVAKSVIESIQAVASVRSVDELEKRLAMLEGQAAVEKRTYQ